jgi:hypothetical protein
MTPRLEIPAAGNPDHPVIGLILASMAQPDVLFIAVVIGCTIAIIGRRELLIAFLGYCLAGLGLILLIASAFALPHPSDRTGWIIAGILTYTASVLTIQYIARYITPRQ